MYTFYLIFCAVGMSSSWRRDQNIGLCPYSWEALSHGVILALQGFLFMALWVLNSSVSWPSPSGRAESSLSPSSAWSLLVQGLCRSWDPQGGNCPALGEVPSLPGELLTSGVLFQGDIIVFCGHGFGPQWLLDVVLPLVPSVSRGYLLCKFHMWFQDQLLPWPSPMTKWPWSDPNWRAQFAELVWKIVFSSPFLFSWEIRAAPCHDMTAVLLMLMGKWEEFMARSKREGDTVTYSDSCMKFINMYRKPHFPVCSSQWSSRKS